MERVNHIPENINLLSNHHTAMKMQKVYVIFSHFAEDTQYEVLLASADVNSILAKWTELGIVDNHSMTFGTPLTVEIIKSKGLLDSPYMDDGRRYIIDSFDLAVPQNKEMYAVLVNGPETCWLADIHALLGSKEDAINFIMERLREWEITDYPEDYRDSLEENNSMVDPQSMYWEIIKVKLDSCDL